MEKAMRSRVVLSVCSAFLVVASCRFFEKDRIVEASAAAMNLAVGDLGEGFAMTSEEGKSNIPGITREEAELLKDASMRYFESGDRLVVGAMIAFKDLTTPSAVLPELLDGFKEGFVKEIPGTPFDKLNPPAIGESAVLTGARVADGSVAVYALAFRKTNLVGLVAVAGPSDWATETVVGNLARKLESRVPAPGT
jgi:hypothetical protein